ncbi:MAG: Transcriptional regulator KdgR [Alphaproteobacteria bacterium MarineAlpha11_Bin1]|nr:MAG: Transcriptional regulator KdgR [Alphaproteobacteria bacterium MarineAlpha11_Bin1]|tara:strand:- start:19882 stop:20616 length:735 start_codon:yes stop_codon:yes gene_type:complete
MVQSRDDNDTKTIRSIERALSVLACFDHERPELSVTQLKKLTGLSRPTLYRILTTLEGKGVIRSYGDPQRFALGHEASRLAASWIGQNEFQRAAGPVLRRLWEETDETVALFVATEDGRKICIEELESRKALTFKRGVGFIESLTVGASGKAILAFTDTAAGDPDYDDVRLKGFRVSEGEIIEGAVAIAAPVFGREGLVKGSVCIFGPEVRLSDSRRDNCIKQVREASHEISSAMGHSVQAAGQ